MITIVIMVMIFMILVVVSGVPAITTKHTTTDKHYSSQTTNTPIVVWLIVKS